MKKINILLLLSFVEGACVMVCELLGAKMIAPVFGTSLQSWATVLCITLIALTSGYYLGSVFLKKNKTESFFYKIYFAAGLFLFAMPLIGKLILSFSLQLPFYAGLFFSLFLILFPSLCLMGMISPFIIQFISDIEGQAGSNAGKVYAISTLGGILGTLICAFFTLPFLGIRMTALLFGSLMMGTLVVFYFTYFKKTIPFIICAVILFFWNISLLFSSKDKNILFQKEGVLGQIKVIEVETKLPSQTIKERLLMVNNTWQSRMDVNTKKTINPYVNFLFGVIEELRQKQTIQNSLLIGLGSGSIANYLVENKIKCDAVEFDEQVINVAKDFFYLDKNVNCIHEDGRYFLNTLNSKYDMIIFDAFWGDNPPDHLITKEAFEKSKEKLNQDGTQIVIFFGEHEGENGKANQMLYKTLRQVYTNVYPIPLVLKSTTFNNFIYLASDSKIDFSGNNFQYTSPYVFDNMNLSLGYIDNMQNTNEEILTDNQSSMDYYLQKASLDYRVYQQKEIQNQIKSNSNFLFY